MNGDKFSSGPSKLADLVDYQPGAVVSKSLIKKKAGTVTLFAFDAGEGLSEHTAPYDALVHLIDGEAEITLCTKSLHIKAGDMIILPANEPYALKAVKQFKMLLTMVRS